MLPTVAHGPRMPLESLALLVLAMLEAPKFTMPPAVVALMAPMRSTAPATDRVTLLSPPDSDVEPTISTFDDPPRRSSAPPASVSTAESLILLVLFTE